MGAEYRYEHERGLKMAAVKIYRHGGVWCYAAWLDGEYDHSDSMPDADSEEDARAEVLAMWPDASVRRVDDV